MRFRNPANGYEEASSVPFLWALLFGPFYFLLKGVWRHVILYLVVTSILLGAARVLIGVGVVAVANISPEPTPTGHLDALRASGAAALIVLLAPFLFYPFVAAGIVRRHYLRNGWIEVV